ncbi:RHS repeat-associated core domain-containing protein [Anditalea andensis]|uniref:RHS repeat-associated core domain-containing protein n=1 Tax=Anditalea andensis TaxID=1048983 RepID=UPI0013E0C6CC|nr:RHS repeat-associated core domain-containing protein [Anditalea andensis]
MLRNPTMQGFIATMETENAMEEEATFSQLSESRQLGPEHNVTEGGNQVAWLNADRGRIAGPGRTQPIYAGDSVTLRVHGKYADDNITKINAGSYLTESAKDRMVDGLSELAGSLQRSGTGNPIAILNLANIIAGDLQNKEAPEAYLIYALYDQDSNRYEVGKQVLTKNAANQHEVLEENLYISEDGYLETFVVNETPEDVWFDDFMVMSTTSPIMQETHYDPWGLVLEGIGFQYGGIKANKYLYNGKELLDHLNLGLYDYGARFYDPAIGRWSIPDPMSHLREWVSPYNFVQNNPLNRIDPDGRFDWVINKDNEVYWDENATSQATTKTGETYLGKSGTGVDEGTGNTLIYNSDGTVSQGVKTLGEVTVTASQSRHERTMSNPVVQNMRANSERIKSEAIPFARHMTRSTIDAAGYTGAGITALGGVVTPFVPPVGAGLIGVGGAVSTVAGGASTLMYAAEGDYRSAAIEGSLMVTGAASGRYLKNMASPARGLINSTTDLPILQGLKNTSLDIVNLIIVPKVK